MKNTKTITLVQLLDTQPKTGLLFQAKGKSIRRNTRKSDGRFIYIVGNTNGRGYMGIESIDAVAAYNQEKEQETPQPKEVKHTEGE